MKDMVVDVGCPNCGGVHPVKVKNMYPGQNIHCTCGCQINFTGDDGRKVQRSLDKLERSLKKLNRTIKFKL